MPTTDVGESGFMHYVSSQIDPTLDWSVVDWLLRTTKLPVLVKGVMRGDDADEAVRRGVQGIIVSNHGGRQLDSAPATIEALPEVVRAVRGRVPKAYFQLKAYEIPWASTWEHSRADFEASQLDQQSKTFIKKKTTSSNGMQAHG
ncbi:hypothetical protein KIN20_025913 [Parelaphostrongylus tenuis]|uniref:FMN hydroxy acid dehydrogenase domain-containing protein n=1 Tax=Parelaphostrongylus tenuis TaxID=148309 RepID=A0AAD5QWV4_PARTN|nr:hypothetical protein KIN20_025913 [Parelaphostrongylus tenuis]